MNLKTYECPKCRHFSAERTRAMDTNLGEGTTEVYWDYYCTTCENSWSEPIETWTRTPHPLDAPPPSRQTICDTVNELRRANKEKT